MCQNVSIEIWIRAAKLSEKNPIVSQDMDKIQTELPQNEMHSPLTWMFLPRK